MGPLGELGALFNPGMRHEMEERRSKALRREEEGNARKDRERDLQIDLESGVAVVGRSAGPRPTETPDATDSSDEGNGPQVTDGAATVPEDRAVGAAGAGQARPRPMSKSRRAAAR